MAFGGTDDGQTAYALVFSHFHILHGLDLAGLDVGTTAAMLVAWSRHRAVAATTFRFTLVQFGVKYLMGVYAYRASLSF